MMSDGVVASEEEGSSLLEKGGDAPSPIPGVALRKVTMELPEKQESSSAASGAVLLKDCSKYGKYFKMMKVCESVRQVVCMQFMNRMMTHILM